MVNLCSPFRPCHYVIKFLMFRFGLYKPIANFSSSNLSDIVNNDSFLYTRSDDVWKGVTDDESNVFWLEYLSVCVFTNLVALVGLMGNFLNLIILSRTGMGRDTTTLLLLALAVCDIMVIIAHLVRYAPCFTCYLENVQYLVDTHIFLYSSFNTVVSGILSVDITAIIALERAVAVYFPFQVASIFRPKTVKITLVFLLLFFVPILLPGYIATGIRAMTNGDLNSTVVYAIYARMLWTEYFNYMTWMENFFLTAGFSMVFLCGSATALKLIHQSKNRKLMTSNLSSSNSSQETKAVKMLLIVCFFSFFANIPNICSNFIANYYGRYLQQLGWFCFMRGMSTVFIVVNSSVNFFIYFFMSSKFKKAYMELFDNCKSMGCFRAPKNT